VGARACVRGGGPFTGPSPISTFSLCLLAQKYQQACELLQLFQRIDFTAMHVKEVERLAQLIDLPIFNFARIQITTPQRYAFLVKAFYGVLMMLPQSDVHARLKARLEAIPGIIRCLAPLEDDAHTSSLVGNEQLQADRNGGDDGDMVGMDELLAHFQAQQDRCDAASVAKQRMYTGLVVVGK
jgi:vacuole morphology and inheritance protein 14